MKIFCYVLDGRFVRLHQVPVLADFPEFFAPDEVKLKEMFMAYYDELSYQSMVEQGMVVREFEWEPGVLKEKGFVGGV